MSSYTLAPFNALTAPRSSRERSAKSSRFGFAAFRDWNNARLTRKALSNLSDHMLRDIGLERSDIDSIGTVMRSYR